MSSKALFLFIIAWPAFVVAQQPSVDAEREARVAWLKEHAIPLRSIDPADEDFSDLEPLRKAIGEAASSSLASKATAMGRRSTPRPG